MAIENLKKHNDFNTFNFYCSILAICLKKRKKKEKEKEKRRLDHSSFELTLVKHLNWNLVGELPTIDKARWRGNVELCT
jgi:hypothetical protein